MKLLITLAVSLGLSQICFGLNFQKFREAFSNCPNPATVKNFDVNRVKF